MNVALVHIDSYNKVWKKKNIPAYYYSLLLRSSMTHSQAAETQSDQQLVTMALENQEHFLLIMQRYEQKLFWFVKRISNMQDEEIQDILQEVFIKVYKNLNDYDPKLKFSSWIYRIARNHTISQFRKNSARPNTTTIDDPDNNLAHNLASDLNIERDIDHILQQETIHKILKQIDPKYREVLILKYLEEKEYQEISDILKKPMGTVASLLNRAKKQFQKVAKQQGVQL